ncbi:MAG TPA: DUF6279 family lipoprotein [Lautropia sp.]|nr:DUF6279 family lipoprotein [Lautropia sp.]
MSLLAGACSAVKLGYENLPLVVGWQADRYLSLDDDQEALVSRHAKLLQRWHRRSLLPVYADFLRQVEEELGNPVTAGQVAGWRQRVVSAWLPLAEQAAPAVAEVAVTLRPEQLAHLQKALVRANAKSDAEYRPPDPAKREQARYARLVERAESLLGDTTSAQKELMRNSAAAMARSEDAWWRARLARQKAVVDLLTELAAEKPPAAEATRRARVVLAGLFSHHDSKSASSAVPASGAPESTDHRALRLTVERASEAGDDLTAGLLALATPEQRRNAVKRLHSYRQDFHLLAAR